MKEAMCRYDFLRIDSYINKEDDVDGVWDDFMCGRDRSLHSNK